MDANNPAEILFDSVTDQLQVFGWIVMDIDAAIIDMTRNGLLYRPNTNKEISEKKTNLFLDFPEELQITAILCVVQ